MAVRRLAFDDVHDLNWAFADGGLGKAVHGACSPQAWPCLKKSRFRPQSRSAAASPIGGKRAKCRGDQVTVVARAGGGAFDWGAVSLTANCLHWGPGWRAEGRPNRAADLVQASSVPAGRDPLCGVAVFPFHAQLTRRRGTAGPARDRGQLWDDPVLDARLLAAELYPVPQPT